MNLSAISVLITTYNEEKNIERCLEPLRGFGEILLVDSHSTDRTVEIAARHGVRTVSRPYESAAKQKNWALQQMTHDWVLILDADEALSAELKREIEALDSPPACEGYWIHRQSDYLGHRIRFCGWQRDKVLRLIHRQKARYRETEVHEEIVLDGEPGFLFHRLRHYPYASIEQHVRKINTYTTRGAVDFVRRGGRFPLLRLLVHPPLRFLRMYIVRGGVFDGLPGLLLCLLSSYSVMLKYAKAWESTRRPSPGA